MCSLTHRHSVPMHQIFWTKTRPMKPVHASSKPYNHASADHHLLARDKLLLSVPRPQSRCRHLVTSSDRQDRADVVLIRSADLSDRYPVHAFLLHDDLLFHQEPSRHAHRSHGTFLRIAADDAECARMAGRLSPLLFYGTCISFRHFLDIAAVPHAMDRPDDPLALPGHGQRPAASGPQQIKTRRLVPERNIVSSFLCLPLALTDTLDMHGQITCFDLRHFFVQGTAKPLDDMCRHLIRIRERVFRIFFHIQ